MKTLLPASKILPRPAVIQRKLKVNEPGDVYEQEADEVADAIMRMPDAPVTVQRKCAHCEDEEKEEHTQRKESGGGVPTASAAAPMASAAVHETLATGGRALDAPTRSFMEQRFGHDFGSVRIHDDARAQRSARDIQAFAYTHRSHIVFGEGQYRPGTSAGRRLLAHELAHVIQQGRAGDRLSRNELIQRACSPAICPPVAVPIPAFDPLWRYAESCLQDLYEETHPGNTIGKNKGWINLAGKDPAEQQALNCLKGGKTGGYYFTAKSGMAPGEPDLWDFSNRTMYEITTLSGMAFRIGKLAAEIKLANDITGTMDCGGTMYMPGTWTPPASCYLVPGGLYMRFVQNAGGVLVYEIVKDGSKELVTAVGLALLYALMKSGMGGAARRLAGRLAPAYAAAAAIATAYLLASGKAEAKVGVGGDDPLEALFKSMAQKGAPVPQELKDFIESDPALKQKIEEGLRKGDVSDAQKALNEKLLKTINDNKDQFTKDELEALLGAAQVSGGALPQRDLTVAEIKKLADTKPAGKGPGADDSASGGSDASAGSASGGSDAGNQAAKGDADKNAGAKDADKQGGAKDAGGGQGKGDDVPAGKGDQPAQDADLNRKYPKLSTGSKQQIKGASNPVESLWEAYVTQAGDKAGLDVTDDIVKRFFAIVPANLTSDQAQAVISRLEVKPGSSVDEVFESLQKGIKDAQANPTAGQGAANVQAPPPTNQPVETRDQVIERLKKRATATNFGTIVKGRYQIAWGPDDFRKDSFSAALTGRTPQGVGYVGDVTLKVVSRNDKGGTFVAKFLSTSPFVTAKGEVLFDSGAFATDQLITLKNP